MRARRLSRRSAGPEDGFRNEQPMTEKIRSVDDIPGLGTRAYRRLCCIGTLEDIRRYTESDFLHMRNLGKKTFREIREKLAEHGIPILPGPRRMTLKLEELGLYPHTRKMLGAVRIWSVQELVKRTAWDLFMPGISVEDVRKELTKLKLSLRRYQSEEPFIGSPDIRYDLDVQADGPHVPMKTVLLLQANGIHGLADLVHHSAADLSEMGLGDRDLKRLEGMLRDPRAEKTRTDRRRYEPDGPRADIYGKGLGRGVIASLEGIGIRYLEEVAWCSKPDLLGLGLSERDVRALRRAVHKAGFCLMRPAYVEASVLGPELAEFVYKKGHRSLEYFEVCTEADLVRFGLDEKQLSKIRAVMADNDMRIGSRSYMCRAW